MATGPDVSCSEDAKRAARHHILEAIMASKKMARLATLIGFWNTTGAVLATAASPATTLAGTDIYRWLPGEHFMVHEVDARFGSMPTRSMEVIGHDASSGRYLANSYNDQGTIEQSELALDGHTLRITGATSRFQGTFDAAGNELAGLWELHAPQAGRQPWIELKLVRAN